MLSGNGTAAGRAGAGKYLSRKEISPAGLPAASVACWSAWEQPAAPLSREGQYDIKVERIDRVSTISKLSLHK